MIMSSLIQNIFSFYQDLNRGPSGSKTNDIPMCHQGSLFLYLNRFCFVQINWQPFLRNNSNIINPDNVYFFESYFFLGALNSRSKNFFYASPESHNDIEWDYIKQTPTPTTPITYVKTFIVK